METMKKVGRSEAQRSRGGSGSPDYDVAIIGAGPYGLLAAAHLKAKGLGVRIFGEPMEFWANTMPEGMLLATAARSFGPLLYFVAGTEFASRHLTDDICHNRVGVS